MKHDIEECVKRLNLKPGEVAVLRFPDRLTEYDRQFLQEQWARLGLGSKLLILDLGASLEVLVSEMEADLIEGSGEGAPAEGVWVAE